MENNITIIDNVLPAELCDELISKYAQCGSADSISRKDYSTCVLVNELNNHERGRLVEHLNNYLPSVYGYNFTAMFYRWTHLSYIPVCDYSHVTHSITVHLNKNYNVREGGVFLYRLNGESHWTGVEPVYNRLVHTEGRVDQFVTPVTSNRDKLSLQLFDIV